MSKDVRQTGDERGESLIELLASTAILGLAVVAIIGALMMAVDTSALHRDQVRTQNLLRNWAETVSDTTYNDCAGTRSFPSPEPLPAGFTAQVTAVQYWTGSTFSATCSPPDSGLQKVTLKIGAPPGLHVSWDEELDVIVRKPCESGC